MSTSLSKKIALRASLTLAALLGGCALWRPATVPLRTIAQPASCATAPDTLIVLLPGSYSLPEDFMREGFVQAVRERHLAADLLLVDAHTGYYDRRSIVTRLHADVMVPARAKGYRHIWLAGISIGGVGAMLYADTHPDEVDGVVLLAPFLGSRLITQEIQIAGGLGAWQAPAIPVEGDIDNILWRWLQSQTQPTAPGHKLPLFLGYGLSDRFVHNAEVLGGYLPASHVFTMPGGHDWPVWRPLWHRVVEVLPIRHDGSCA